MQRLFLLMDPSRPNSASNNGSFVIEGPIVAEQLRQAFEAVIARHTILRTAFLAQGTDELLQVVLPRVELPWAEKDWRTLTIPTRKPLSGLLDADAATGSISSALR